jgi:hypothetical protein
MRKLCWLFIVVLLVIPFTACNTTQDEADAQTMIMGYFDTIEAGDFVSALDYYSQEFYEKEISKAEMLQVLEGVNEKLGDLEFYALKNTNISVTNIVSGPDKGKRIISCRLVYDTTYSNNTATETYLLEKVNDEKFAIRGFNINSLGLLK